MTRTGKRAPSRGPGLDPDTPVAGWFRVRLRKGTVDSAVHIFWGTGRDPDGEEMLERPCFWQCELNGQRVPVEHFWPACARDQIPEEEGLRLTQRNRTMDSASVFYDPRQKLDINSAPPPF